MNEIAGDTSVKTKHLSFNQLNRILKEYYTALKKIWPLTNSTSQKRAQNYRKHLECKYNKNAKCSYLKRKC